MMTEFHQFLQHLKQPEYVHVLLNPLPVYATAMGVLALLIGLGARRVPAQAVGVVIILVGCASVWPVVEYGESAEDRVQAMSNKDGRVWLETHASRADTGKYVFFATAVLAVVTLVSQWKFPKAATKLATATLLAAVISVGVGCWISQAGGQVRHSEFRDGPPPNPVEHIEHEH